MPLNLSVADGEFTPYIKYNSKAGRWYVKVEGQKDEVEVFNPRLAIDMANIKTGWIMFSEGMGPMSVWDNGSEMAVKPEGKYKRGFHVMVCGGDSLPGIGVLGLREWSSTAGVANTAMISMYELYEQQVGQHPGQVPFYQCTGVNPISGMYGTNYEPLFQLVSWIDRKQIPAFDEHLRTQAPVPQMPAHQAPAQQGTWPVHPPPNPNAPPDFAQPSQHAPQGTDAGLDDEIPF